MKIHPVKIKAVRLLKKINWFDSLRLSISFAASMLSKLSILVKAASAIIMIAALCFLTTANFWAYGIKKEKQTAATPVPNPAEEESGSKTSVPNPVEEKSSNTLQNLSEYLHNHQHNLEHPVALHFFGNRHDIINYPVHHCELITPPPKTVA